jgi:NADH dehydrogenase [ubiquinone] 1 alpha subcomplex assembly factor 2
MGAIRDLWLRWKMLRLPWRKTFLVGTLPLGIQLCLYNGLELTVAGHDLYGNTFWEFKDQINPGRWRRMIKGKGRATISTLSDVQITPQWHQWLRYTRHEPPSLQEQVADVQRLAQLKINAKLADERWAAKAKYIETPRPPSPPRRTVAPKSDRLQGGNIEPPRAEDTKNVIGGKKHPLKNVDDTATTPGSTWTPQGWTPGPSKR